jgi:thiamine-monophosphate kinase
MEAELLSQLQKIATDPAARGLCDDVALLGDLILTHDMLVEGVHFLSSDRAEDVAWKLVAVNLSDLASKGAVPVAMLLGAGLRRDAAWNAAFIRGIGVAAETFGIALIGGDTVAMPEGAPTSLGLTAIGRATGPVPSRAGAGAGDALYVAGVIGDAGLGLAMALGQCDIDAGIIAAYQRPIPLIETGRALSPIVTAMMDVSDGLLIDAQRMATASGTGVEIDLDMIPRSGAARTIGGDDRAAIIKSATAGDDYALLFTAARPLPPVPGRITRIGQMTRTAGLRIYDRDGDVPLPDRLGWLHG